MYQPDLSFYFFHRAIDFGMVTLQQERYLRHLRCHLLYCVIIEAFRKFVKLILWIEKSFPVVFYVSSGHRELTISKSDIFRSENYDFEDIDDDQRVRFQHRRGNEMGVH